jgi:hypothetical protein
MATSPFLDRLRGTGPLTPERALQHGVLGPISKAAGFADDARLTRLRPVPGPATGPVGGGGPGFGLIRATAGELAERTGNPARLPCEPAGVAPPTRRRRRKARCYDLLELGGAEGI